MSKEYVYGVARTWDGKLVIEKVAVRTRTKNQLVLAERFDCFGYAVVLKGEQMKAAADTPLAAATAWKKRMAERIAACKDELAEAKLEYAKAHALIESLGEAEGGGS